MDDFVLNVRQIAQFGAKPFSFPTDLFMGQEQLGAPYYQTSAFGLVQGALQQPGSSLTVGFPPPANIGEGVYSSAGFSTFLGSDFAWNTYWDTAGNPRNLASGAAAAFRWDGSRSEEHTS